MTRTLKNAVSSGRVAHAFLFAGARGVGKTTTARVLAKALNCVEGPTIHPCGVCDQCQGIADARAVDVHEIDGASNNSVDDVRALRETVPYQPASGRYKIFIVDEVHMLSTSAFNALLKTLEEPPPHVKFIFATTEPHKIPVTILSRCQRYDFRLVPQPLVRQQLATIVEAEGVEAEAEALSLLAFEAQGSVRDALSLLDRALAFNPERLEAAEIARLLGVAQRALLFQVSRALLERDAALALRAVDTAATVGCDLTRFGQDLLRHLRNLVVAAQCPAEADLLDCSPEEREELGRQAQGHPVAELHRLFLLFSRAVDELARSSVPRLILEMTLARLASLEPMRSLEQLAQQLERLAAGTGSPQSGSVSPPALAPAPSFPGAGPPAPRTMSTREGPPRRSPPGEGAFVPPAFPPTEGRKEVNRETPAPRSPEVNAASPRGQGTPPSTDDPAALWASLLNALKKTSPPLYHLLRYAEPLEVSLKGLKLSLPDEPFFQGEAKNPQRAEAVRDACFKLWGTQVPVELVVAEGTQGGLAQKEHIEHAAREHDRRQEALAHTMVRAALSEFDGAQVKKVRLFKDKDE